MWDDDDDDDEDVDDDVEEKASHCQALALPFEQHIGAKSVNESSK